MNKIIKIVCLAIALMMVFVAFASCIKHETSSDTTKTPESGNNSTEEGEETIQPIGIPNDVTFGGQSVMILAWDDYTMQEFEAEGITGNEVNDAIYERNNTIQEKLDIKIEYTYTPGSSSSIENYISKVRVDAGVNGTGEYDIFAAYSQIPASLAMEGMLADLRETEYLDFSMPWWPEQLIQETTINDKLYFCSGDISTNMLWMMTAAFFNKNLINSYGLEDPYELVEQNQWTLEKMMEMSEGKYVDNDNSGTKTVADTFGYMTYSINIDAFFTSCGLRAVEKNADDELVISKLYNGEKITDLIEKLGGWFASGGEGYQNSSTKSRAVFFEERAVFTMDRIFIVAGKDNSDTTDKIEFGFGILPVPKYDSNQSRYYTNVGYPFTMYCISAVKSDTDAASATLEYLAYESAKLVTPAVFENAMKIRYASDEVASASYDLIRNSVTFELGRIFTIPFNNLASTQFRSSVLANNGAWTSNYNSIDTMLGKAIDSVMSQFN